MVQEAYIIVPICKKGKTTDSNIYSDYQF